MYLDHLHLRWLLIWYHLGLSFYCFFWFLLLRFSFLDFHGFLKYFWEIQPDLFIVLLSASLHTVLIVAALGIAACRWHHCLLLSTFTNVSKPWKISLLFRSLFPSPLQMPETEFLKLMKRIAECMCLYFWSFLCLFFPDLICVLPSFTFYLKNVFSQSVRTGLQQFVPGCLLRECYFPFILEG